MEVKAGQLVWQLVEVRPGQPGRPWYLRKKNILYILFFGSTKEFFFTKSFVWCPVTFILNQCNFSLHILQKLVKLLKAKELGTCTCVPVHMRAGEHAPVYLYIWDPGNMHLCTCTSENLGTCTCVPVHLRTGEHAPVYLYIWEPRNMHLCTCTSESRGTCTCVPVHLRAGEHAPLYLYIWEPGDMHLW